jgi:2-dehydro-3-deoxygluconokinase
VTGTVACVGEPLIVFSMHSMLDSSTAEVSEGGAEFNVAVHLARLGLPVRFVGAVGADDFGRRIEARLRREGVDVSALQRQPAGRTGAYVKDRTPGRNVAYLRTGSAAARFAPAPDAFAGVRHVHLSGITAALSAECAALLDRLLGRPRAYSVSFDVNYRAKLWPSDRAAPRLARMAAAADIVLVGRDEAEQLWGTATAEDVRRRLPEPTELVVTDEARPATAWLGADRIAVAPEPVEVIEPVGAGDAFAAGYLYGRLRGHPQRFSLAVGHRLALAVLRATDDLGPAVPVEELDRVLGLLR